VTESEHAESEEISLEKALSMPMVFKGSFGEVSFLALKSIKRHPAFMKD
jgi:hypothetical protein